MDRATNSSDFLVPAFLVILGGAFINLTSWAWVGGAILFISAVNVSYLVYAGIQDFKMKQEQENHFHIAEILRLDTAKTTSKVVVDKTSIEGNYFSRAYVELKIPPTKLKLFAQGALGGKKLTIREWTPVKDGKLFSDGEWRRLITFMKQPVHSKPDIKFVFQVHPDDERKGFDLTDTGKKWLQDILDARVLMPS